MVSSVQFEAEVRRMPDGRSAYRRSPRMDTHHVHSPRSGFRSRVRNRAAPRPVVRWPSFRGRQVGFPHRKALADHWKEDSPWIPLHRCRGTRNFDEDKLLPLVDPLPKSKCRMPPPNCLGIAFSTLHVNIVMCSRHLRNVLEPITSQWPLTPRK